MTRFLVFLAFLFFSFPSFGEPLDYSKYFEVDLDAPVPDLQNLSEELKKASAIYEPRYVLSWDMGSTFDNIWRYVIRTYGTSEKRIRAAGEDDLVEMILTLPKEFYPYIGPFLHSAPGIPEKILNLPGIKETKHKFPERIAPQLADVENLEFLSPYLYILLMPEMWPENNKDIETPKMRRAKIPKVPYTPDFYKNISKKIKEGGYGGPNEPSEVAMRDNLRTLKITKSSPLTTADIKAFTNTLDGVLAFSTLDNKYKLIQAEGLLDYYEAKNDMALDMNTLKDIVNPCQRLALKIRWAGLETEFLKIVSKEGFNLKEWALTCDKTIKAYRTILISDAKLTMLQEYKKGFYNSHLRSLTPKWRNRQYATLQSFIEMYKTTPNDVRQALKNESVIKEKLKPFGSMLLTSPLSD